MTRLLTVGSTSGSQAHPAACSSTGGVPAVNPVRLRLGQRAWRSVPGGTVGVGVEFVRVIFIYPSPQLPHVLVRKAVRQAPRFTLLLGSVSYTHLTLPTN